MRTFPLLNIGVSLTALLAALLAPAPTSAQKKQAVKAAPAEPSIVYPASAGLLNVKAAPYFARGDGKTDDTQAIQRALSDGLDNHQIVYLPNGVYRVTDTLRWRRPGYSPNETNGWGAFLQLQGQSRAKTVIRLDASAPGFGDAGAPKAVIATGSRGYHGSKGYRNGEGNEAFENHLRDFTVEVGPGNPGAIGIDYQVSNCGAMRRVTVRAAKGSGAVGINLTRRDNGPGLIKNVTVSGFGTGVSLAGGVSQIVLEDLTLTGQRDVAIVNNEAILCARHLRTAGSVPALRVGGASLTILLDSFLQGQAAAGARPVAITADGNEARLLLRGVQTPGYAGSVVSRGKTETRLQLDEWTSDPTVGAGTTGARLAVRETPDWYDPDLSRWADVGPPSGKDDTDAIQAALSSGKPTVFFGSGRYFVSRPLVVGPHVRRIQGLGAELTPKAPFKDAGLFRLGGGKAADVTVFDRLALAAAEGFVIDHGDARTVVTSDLIEFGGSAYRNTPRAGPLFVEDVSGSGYLFAPGSRVWGRNFNAEGNAPVIPSGVQLWALGWKTESGGTLLINRGGTVEMLGGLVYTFGTDPALPAFVNEGGSLTLSFAGANYTGGPNGFFSLLVRDTNGKGHRELRRDAVPGRGNAASVVLYRSPAP